MKMYQKYLLEIEPATMGMIAAGIGITSGIMAITNMVSQLWLQTMNAAASKCNTIVDTKEKSKCMLNYKINGLRQIITKLQSSKSACKGNMKCIDKLNNKIKAEQSKLKTFSDQLRNIINPPKI